MRPHRLEITAFGPFAGTATVHFDDLASAGLVLLHGETGAGKSSILDALGYALYGEVPGVRGIKRLRSDHAAPETETLVRLEFSASGRHLRISRSPRQEVARLRGKGTRTLQPQVRLEERAGATWRHLADRLDEAGQIVGDVLGLSAAQFFQVVLLPQGGFAEFLHAPAAERQHLLERLFGTHRFADVERELASRRGQLAEQVRTAETELRWHLDVVAQAVRSDAGNEDGNDAGNEDADEQDDRAGSLSSAQGAREKLVALDAQCSVAEAEWESARERERRAREFLQQQEDLAARQQRVGRLLEQQQQLQERGPRITQLRGQVEAARRAALVAAALALVDRADRLVVSRTAEFDKASRRLPAALRGAGLDEVAAVEAERRRQLAEAEGLLPLLAEARSAEAAAAAANSGATAAREALAVLDVQGEVARQARDEAAAALHADQVVAAGAPEAAQLADAAQGRVAAAAALPAARRREASAREEFQALRELSLQAREHAVDVRTRRLAGMAAELAAGLVDGAPCAVCGSAVHPAPAHSDERVDDATEAVASSEVERTGLAVELAQQTVQAVVAEITALVAVCGVEPDLTALRAEARATTSRAKQAAAAAERLPQQLLAAEQASAAVDRVAEARELAGEQVAVALQQLAAASATAAGLRERLMAAAITDLPGHIEGLRRQIAASESYRRALELLTDARGARDRARAECLEQARSAGFDDVDQAAVASLPPDRADALEQRVREHDEAAAAVRTGLADPELAVIDGAAADVPVARQAVEEAVARHQAAHTLLVRLRAKLQDSRSAVERAAALESEIAPLRQHAATLETLAELTAGGAGNRLRMSLSSFVLAARLERVAARASVRLSTMTSGRYTLHHSDEVGDARRKHGLGLVVRDVWTGVERPTSSLSGGETFMTALSLALGLADVAAEEAGGRRIDALFIDEGFGTLDEETLDRVMEVIDGLRGGGRLVGVVSHVSELRRRVPAQLRVVRTEHGSTVEALVPTG